MSLIFFNNPSWFLNWFSKIGFELLSFGSFVMIKTILCISNHLFQRFLSWSSTSFPITLSALEMILIKSPMLTNAQVLVIFNTGHWWRVTDSLIVDLIPTGFGWVISLLLSKIRFSTSTASSSCLRLKLLLEQTHVMYWELKPHNICISLVIWPRCSNISFKVVGV